MTDSFARVVSGSLFLGFSAFGLLWLRREYRQKGRLTVFGTIVHILVFAFHAMFTGTLVTGADARHPPPGLLWLGLPLMVTGFVIMLFGMDLFRRFPRWLGSATPGLKTDGLYRYSRNPQFVGYALLILGYLLSYWNSLAWVGLLAYAALVYAVTRIEEEHLGRIYGDPYREYCSRVPRYLGFPKRS